MLTKFLRKTEHSVSCFPKCLARLLGLCSLLFASLAQANDDDKTKFLVGYLDHPSVVNVYKRIIADTYADLGIELEFIKVGSERGMILVNEGLTDADVIRYIDFSERFPDALFLEPIIAQGITLLVCNPDVVCDRSVLKDRKSVVITSLILQDSIKKALPSEEVAAEIVTMDNHEQMLQMLSTKRLNYAIFPVDKKLRDSLMDRGFNVFILSRSNAFHVINKKHAHLRDKLSAAIRKQMLKHGLPVVTDE